VNYFDDGELRLPQRELDFSKLFRQANLAAWTRTDSARTPPFHTRSGFIRRTAYEIGCHIADEDLWDGFQSYLQSNIRRSEHPATKQKIDNVRHNPFYWCLMCIDGQVISDRDEVLLPHGRVPKLSRQLLFAFGESVEVRYVIGFTYQNGSKESSEDGPIVSNWFDENRVRLLVDVDEDEDEDEDEDGDWDEE
jgi:hypothetical protein